MPHQAHSSKFRLEPATAIALVRDALTASVAKTGAVAPNLATAGAVLEHCAALAAYLVGVRDFNGPRWEEALLPYLEAVTGYEEAEGAVGAMCELAKNLGAT